MAHASSIAMHCSPSPCCSSEIQRLSSTTSCSFVSRLHAHQLSSRFTISPALEHSQEGSRSFAFHAGRIVKVEAIDAAQAFDYEAKRSKELNDAAKLKIGIVGFGNFGQFLAKKIVQQGHTVLAHSRSDYSEIACEMGVSYFSDPDDFCEEHPEVILLCTSILSTESVLYSLPTQRLRRSTLFVDVLSVKEFPRNLFLRELPAELDILCTHPMFGPQSGKSSWAGLPFVYDKVRIGGGARADRCEKFLKIFYDEGCRMVEMTCEEHDCHAAASQFITHTVGRVLGKLGLESSPINTKGYEQLLHLVENTNSDSFDLYYGLFMYNVNATEQLERLELAFDSVKKQLFTQLHEILRKQIFAASEPEKKSTVAVESFGAEKFTEKISDIVGQVSLHSSLNSVESAVDEKHLAGSSGDLNDQ